MGRRVRGVWKTVGKIDKNQQILIEHLLQKHHTPGFFPSVLQETSEACIALSSVEITYLMVRGKTVSVGSSASDSINIKYECGGGHQAAMLEQSPDYIYSTSSQKNLWLLSIYIALFVSKPLCKTSLMNSLNLPSPVFRTLYY